MRKREGTPQGIGTCLAALSASVDNKKLCCWRSGVLRWDLYSCVFAILTKWFSLTRLETRTKESNTCASQGLARKPPWRNEGEGRRRSPAEVGSRGLSSPPRAHHRPVSPAAPGRWSTSARVRTRKMVNYAWAGRSQRKLWWRSVAVLTCKSVVRPGYRGERLIEPSSSWFPPKFPSG